MNQRNNRLNNKNMYAQNSNTVLGLGCMTYLMFKTSNSKDLIREALVTATFHTKCNAFE